MRSLLLTSLILLSFVYVVIGHHHCHCHKHKCCKKEVHHHHDHEGHKVHHKHGHGHGHKHSHHHANHHHHHHTGGGHSEHGHQGHVATGHHGHAYTSQTNQLAKGQIGHRAPNLHGSLVNNLLTGGRGGGTTYLLQRGQSGNNLYQAVQAGVQNNQQGTRALILQQPGLAEMAKQGQLGQLLNGGRLIIV